MSHSQFKRSSLPDFPAFCVLVVFALHGLPAHAAPPLPDAGQTLRELQRQPVVGAPSVAPETGVKDKAAVAADDGLRFVIKRIDISGNSEISTAELQALVAPLLRGEHTLAELNAAVERITGYYRRHGYLVARAYIPEQEVKDGVVAINIIEGRIGEYRIDNRSRVSDERVASYLGRGKGGGTIVGARIERGLLLLNDTPGIGSSRATLQPGASVGTSDLLVELTPSEPWSASFTLDNYGNRYSGETRLGANLNINSPLHVGDQFSLGALTSGAGLDYGRASYQLPLGGSGLRIGAAYFDTRYRLGKEFANLNAHGKATSSSVFSGYPLIRSQRSNLSGTFSWEQKNLTDQVDATTTITGKKIHLAKLGLGGNRRDKVGGGGVNSFELSLTSGKLRIDSPAALAIDNASARSNGWYHLLSFYLSRLQWLGGRNQLFAALSGQQAGKNLDSSEKFSLGGALGVRAYPQGEGVGDEGYLASLELRHNFTDTVQGILFYDTGSVTINRNPFGPPAPNTRSLAGTGAGINALLNGFRIRALLAWRTGGGQPVSIPAGAARNPNIWMQVDKVL